MSRSGPDRLRVDGRFLALGDERIFLKGVTFGPFPPGHELSPALEFPRIAACGFNAVRVYLEPGPDLLDAAAHNRLTVLAGLPWEWGRDFLEEPKLRTEGELRLLQFLSRQRDHPALGALFIANEIPSDLVRWMGPVAVRQALEEIIDLCRSEAGEVLLAYANYPSTEYLEPRNADFTAFNVFLENRRPLHSYLPRLHNIAGDRPVLVSEFGLDTIRNGEEQQAAILSWEVDECLAAGVAGTTLYAWSDRWMAGGQVMSDWAFGLTRPDGSEKPALQALRTKLPAIGTARNALPLLDPPRISVVICTYNGAMRLATCLAACRQLNYPDLEVLVVDDGSTDRTAETVACFFPGVRYLHQDHAGLSAARNHGARAATGGIIAYTDDDCEPDQDWLYWIAHAFADPEVGAAGGPNPPPPPAGRQEAVVAAAPGAPSHVLLDDLRAEHLPGCNLCVRREAFDAVGGFKLQFETAGDDVDFCWRLLAAGWQLAFVPPAFVWHRRRTSVLRYLKQQAGYGRAEALLYAAHPDRFNHSGIAWRGSVYGGGAVTADAHAVIYFGTMGMAGYQSLQCHGLPRRVLAPPFRDWTTRLLLALTEWAQPWSRALARWRHGGPRPRLDDRPTLPVEKVYRDDLREELEASFLGPNQIGRQRLLALLQLDGWEPCEDTAEWDLTKESCCLLTTNERHGPAHTLVKVRLLHAPGLERSAFAEVDRAALEGGLQRV